jgi:hypothetical protein
MRCHGSGGELQYEPRQNEKGFCFLEVPPKKPYKGTRLKGRPRLLYVPHNHLGGQDAETQKPPASAGTV